jgi:hypothetical protein
MEGSGRCLIEVVSPTLPGENDEKQDSIMGA